MQAAAKPTDEPALALCNQLDELMDQEAELGRVWSSKETALRKAQPHERAQAERDFKVVDEMIGRLQVNIERFFRAVEAVRATTAEGAAAKLRVTLRYGSPKEESDEFPWPQIRSVRLDLEELAANDNVAAELAEEQE